MQNCRLVPAVEKQCVQCNVFEIY